MSKPATDREAVEQIIDGLLAVGVRLESVYDQEAEVSTITKEAALEAIFAVDMATLYVRVPETGLVSFVFFVLGNDPEEVAADYGVRLSEYIEPITEGWDA